MINNGKCVEKSLKSKVEEHITTFRRRFEQLRNEKNLSQSYLAETLDISRQTVSKYETFNSKSFPDIQKLCMLCECFDISPNYFLGYSEIMSDHKKNYGLSPQTINYLQLYPNIHQFVDYFVEQLVKNNLEPVISQIGVSNNVENAWNSVFPQKVMMAINKAYNGMIKDAAFSADISSTKMERYLRNYFPAPTSFALYYKNKLNQDAQNFILNNTPDFMKLSNDEQYDCFIKILCRHFVEIKSIQIVHFSTHEKVSNQILDIVQNYVKLLYFKENQE